MKQTIQLDKYAREAYSWRISANVDYRASLLVFQTEDLMLVFPAASMTLRDGLEMFEPFFDELRYPVQMEKFKTLGPMDVIAFTAIIEALTPFTECPQALTPP